MRYPIITDIWLLLIYFLPPPTLPAVPAGCVGDGGSVCEPSSYSRWDQQREDLCHTALNEPSALRTSADSAAQEWPRPPHGLQLSVWPHPHAANAYMNFVLYVNLLSLIKFWLVNFWLSCPTLAILTIVHVLLASDP